MALVSYSDSDGSEDEDAPATITAPVEKPSSNFIFDKSNPNKIKINLAQQLHPSSDKANESEPQAKRQRVGAGPFDSFNALLPAPKRDNVSNTGSNQKSTVKKIFSLKTGAEASFSRESDADFRNRSAEPIAFSGDNQDNSSGTQHAIPVPSFAKPAKPLQGGTALLFKPLSVARNQKKKKPLVHDRQVQQPSPTLVTASVSPSNADKAPIKKKINLFSAQVDTATPVVRDTEADDHPEIRDVHYPADVVEETVVHDSIQHSTEEQAQSLGAIASDLNLTAAQRRQLFGRAGQQSASAITVVNFNTDAEYAANQARIASGETVQHNPVRAIAPGKHSLRQLVNAASVQKEALEESFAEGRRNKREAGNKYGW